MILISSVFVNNFVLSRFLGICPFLGVSKRTDTARGHGTGRDLRHDGGVRLCPIMVYAWILVPTLKVEYLYTIAFILVIASLVQLVEMVIQKVSPALYSALGVYLPLITTNCAVLGVAVLNMQAGYNLLESCRERLCRPPPDLRWALCCFAGVRERICQ